MMDLSEVIFALVGEAISQYDSKCVFAEDTVECYVKTNSKRAGKGATANAATATVAGNGGKGVVPVLPALTQDAFSVDVKNKTYQHHHFAELDLLGRGDTKAAASANAKIIDTISRILVPSSSSSSSSSTPLLPFEKTRELVDFIRSVICQQTLVPALLLSSCSPTSIAMIGFRLFFAACRAGRDSRCLRYRESIRLERVVERWLWEKAPAEVRLLLFPPFGLFVANGDGSSKPLAKKNHHHLLNDDEDEEHDDAAALDKELFRVHMIEGLLTAVDVLMLSRFRIFRFNPSDGQAPMYSLRIKQPMSMSAVAHLIRAGVKITNKEQLFEYVQLIVNNCATYNGNDSEFTSVARQMLDSSVQRAAMGHLPRRDGDTNVGPGPKFSERWFCEALDPGVFSEMERGIVVQKADKKQQQQQQQPLNDDEEAVASSSSFSSSSSSSSESSSDDDSRSSSGSNSSSDSVIVVGDKNSKRKRGRPLGSTKVAAAASKQETGKASTTTKQQAQRRDREEERDEDDDGEAQKADAKITAKPKPSKKKAEPKPKSSKSAKKDRAQQQQTAAGTALSSPNRKKQQLTAEELQDAHDTLDSIWSLVKDQHEPKVNRQVLLPPVGSCSINNHASLSAPGSKSRPSASMLRDGSNANNNNSKSHVNVHDLDLFPVEVVDELAELLGLHEMVQQQVVAKLRAAKE